MPLFSCTITASTYFYENTQIAEASAFENFTEKSQNYVQNFSQRLLDHVQSGKNLLLLKGKPFSSLFCQINNF